MPADFHFLRPWWLLLFFPLIAFLVWYAQRRFERRLWRDIIDPLLLPHVLIGTDYRSRRRISAILAVAGTLMITALAGPVWQQLSQPVFRSQDALVIVLDLSRSMDVADVKPSRLDRARFKINDILEQRDEGQTALIAYAAQPYVISPLTDDTQTIISQLPALTTDLMPAGGSRADRALEKAVELLHQSGVGKSRVLLVTDGVDAEKTGPVAKKLKQQGVRVSVLGVGTDEGGPIPGPDGFIKRSDGSIVIAGLDAASLKQTSAQGGGRFHALSADGSDIDYLFADRAERPGEVEGTGLETDRWREEGPWLLLPLLPLAALAFRRGVLAAWLVAVLPLLILLPVRPAQAFEWADLWLRPDQQAAQLLEQSDPAGAADRFVDPAWKGAASFQAGRYEDAYAELDGLDDPDSIYNRGNALARLGRFDEAIEAYDKVLELNPGDHDARYNRDLLLEQKKKQQQQQQKDGEQASDSSEDTSGKSSEESSGESSDELPQDQSSGEQQPENPSAADSEQKHEQQDGKAGGDQRRDDASMADTGQRPGETGEQPQPADERDAETANQQKQAKQAPDDGTGEKTAVPTGTDEQPLDEDALATEQWLRKIPDDPGGLLRRKFYYQYRQRDQQESEKEPW